MKVFSGSSHRSGSIPLRSKVIGSARVVVSDAGGSGSELGGGGVKDIVSEGSDTGVRSDNVMRCKVRKEV